jgi:hypothetical protein
MQPRRSGRMGIAVLFVVFAGQDISAPGAQTPGSVPLPRDWPERLLRDTAEIHSIIKREEIGTRTPAYATPDILMRLVRQILPETHSAGDTEKRDRSKPRSATL